MFRTISSHLAREEEPGEKHCVSSRGEYMTFPAPTCFICPLPARK